MKVLPMKILPLKVWTFLSSKGIEDVYCRSCLVLAYNYFVHR